MSALARLAGLLGVLTTASCGGLDFGGLDAHRGAALEVTRGDLIVPVVLTGELAAAESQSLSAPRTETFELSIQWLAETGVEVKQGDRLVEFDNAALVDSLAGRELAMLEAGNEWANLRAQQAVEVAEKRFAALQARVELSKTEIDADVPPEIVSRMQYSEYQIARGRAELARDSSQTDETVTSSGAKLEDKVKGIAYAKAERKYDAVQSELEALTITAPRDGVMIVPDHPWEGRKLQVGDTVFPGFTVAELPDLSKMVVRAVLSDVDDGRVHVGMKVSCYLDAHPERELTGLVRSVNPVARELERGSTRRFYSVVIDLDQTEDEQGHDSNFMRPGLSVQAIVESVRLTDVLLIPRVALLEGPEGPLAQLEDGSQVPVELGVCNPQQCELRSGLALGDRLGVAPLPAPLAMVPRDTEAAE